MDRSEKVTLTNMCMVYDDLGQILVQERTNKSWPGITFPGGHVERGEAFVTSVIREVYEETGLRIENPSLCGIKQFQSSDHTRYVVLLFKTKIFSGKLRDSKEGRVFWISEDQLFTYKLADGFEHMYRIIKDGARSEIYYFKDEDGCNLELL